MVCVYFWRGGGRDGYVFDQLVLADREGLVLRSIHHVVVGGDEVLAVTIEEGELVLADTRREEVDEVIILGMRNEEPLRCSPTCRRWSRR